jgi:hypothetical protein
MDAYARSERPFLAHLFGPAADAICSHGQFCRWEDEMSPVRERYGEAFWRAHHEAWQQSELNQREYCEAQGIPLKAFGNWRARFKAEPQPPSPKLLYRRRGLSHTLSHSVSHSVSHRLSHMTNGSPMSGPIVPPAREGHRRQFSGGGQTPDRWGSSATWRQPVGGSARLWDSSACSVPLEAGTDAGGTAVRGDGDRGCDPAHRGGRCFLGA